MTLTRAEIAAAFSAACTDELLALKPGNAHVHSATHKLSVAQFVESARVCAPALTVPGASVGARILDAVTATQAAVGTNTNLGIILLCAPLAAAAERMPTLNLPGRSLPALRQALAATLASLSVADAEAAFRAIALAAPGGLGSDADHDVRAPARADLKAAMASAAGRDRIAFQYAHDFTDVFERGLAACAQADARAGPAWRDPQWRTLLVYLEFLEAFPDSHILRRHGSETAARTQRQAGAMAARLRGTDDPAALTGPLTDWDAALKSAGVNPGTSADLTVATLFARRLAVTSD